MKNILKKLLLNINVLWTHLNFCKENFELKNINEIIDEIRDILRDEINKCDELH